MPTISDKQNAFIAEYMINGHNASQAYKKAYPNTKAGWNKLSARLMAKEGIRSEIGRRMARMADKAEYTQQDSIDRLLRIADASETAKQFSSAVSSVVALNRMFGWDKDSSTDQDQQHQLDDKQTEQANRIANIVLTKPQGDSEDVKTA
jgi:phage terminase small subunit